MNKRIYFVYLFILFIFFISLSKSNIYIPNPRTIHLPRDTGKSCYAKVIPDRSRILFFTNPDGTTDLDTYTQAYYSAEYDLVPSVVADENSGPVQMDEYEWFIGFDMTAEEMNAVINQYHLQIIQKCDKGIVLKRIQ